MMWMFIPVALIMEMQLINSGNWRHLTIFNFFGAVFLYSNKTKRCVTDYWEDVSTKLMWSAVMLDSGLIYYPSPVPVCTL